MCHLEGPCKFPNFKGTDDLMPTIDKIRNNIIDKLLAITNKEYLEGLYKIVENANIAEDRIKLSEEQIVMLKMSDQDIKAKRTKSQSDLDKEDLKWLKEI